MMDDDDDDDWMMMILDGDDGEGDGCYTHIHVPAFQGLLSLGSTSCVRLSSMRTKQMYDTMSISLSPADDDEDDEEDEDDDDEDEEEPKLVYSASELALEE